MADVGSASTSFSGTPQWYSDYLKEVALAGKGLAMEDYVPYEGPRIADWTTDQQTAFNMTRNAAGLWKPGFDAAQDAYAAAQTMIDPAFQAAQQSTQFDRPTYENQYWDIYKPGIEDLQNRAERIGREQFTNTTLADLNKNFVGAGGFGTGRHQILGADAAANAQQKIEDTRAQMYQTGRQQAMQDYLGWSKQGLAGSQQMGTLAAAQAGLGADLWNLGTGATGAQYADAAAMVDIGQQQQAMNQSNLNLAYQDFQNQQQFPWQQASNWVGLVQGQQLPQFSTTQQAQLGSGAFQMPQYTSPFTSGLNAASFFGNLTR